MRYLGRLKILPGCPRSRAPLGRRAARAAKHCCTNPALCRACPSALNLGCPISKSGSLLQNARTMARDGIFGDPATNAFFANGLVKKMKEYGIDVKIPMKDQQQILRMLKHVVLSDHMRKIKAEGKLMTKAEKIEFVSNWK
jgi:hypothetical protein